MLKRGIFSKIFALLLLMSFITGAIILSVSVTERAQSMEEALVRENKLLAETAAQIIEAGYITERWPFRTIKSIADSENITLLWIVRPDGEIYFADDPQMFAQQVVEDNLGTEEVVVQDSVHPRTEERIKLIIQPLWMTPREKPWSLYLGVSLSSVEAARRAIILRGVAIFLVMILLVTIISFYFAKGVADPLRRLRLGVGAVGQGNLDYRIKIRTGDEIEELGETFNQMAGDLQMRHLELMAERDKTKSVIMNLADGLIMHDDKQRLILLNPQAERLLGIREVAVINKRITGTLAGKNVFFKQLYQIINAKTQKGKPLEFKLTEPEERFIQITDIRIKGASQETGRFIKALHDVTREREVEHLKSEFISIASHQLRTPLSVVKWTLKMCLDGDLGVLTREQRDFLEKTYKSNQTMIDLVNDLLDVSRIEEGKLECKESDVDVIRLLEEIILQDKVLLKKKRLELLTNFSEQQSAIVKGDRDKLYLVFSNLVDNAIKFTPLGNQLYILVKEGSDEVQVIVKDTGIGMTAKDQKQLFSKFFRSDAAQRMQTQGSGLGLFIAKNIIERHKGKLIVESVLYKGTTVKCILPK